MYINEVIRITYKCNWKCKFCNVLMTNNFGERDISDKEVIFKILSLAKRYTVEERKRLFLTFSGGEPLLNKKISSYIRLAKEIGIGSIEIQTNGSLLFKRLNYINELIDAGLNKMFLAQHSSDENINKLLGVYYEISDFEKWVNYILENKLNEKVRINLNIVISKINIFSTYKYLNFLLKTKTIKILTLTEYTIDNRKIPKISFGLIQPNGYAELNADELLLKYTKKEVTEFQKFINFCKKNNILSDLHFTSPPICLLNYPDYNLEYKTLKNLEKDSLMGEVNNSNLESYKFLWKEKQKFKECKMCKYDKYCLGFYKNWVKFVGKSYTIKKIQEFINNEK